MEKIRYLPNGLWELEKAWVKDEKDSTPYKNAARAYPTLFGDPKKKTYPTIDYENEKTWEDVPNKHIAIMPHNKTHVKVRHDGITQVMTDDEAENYAAKHTDYQGDLADPSLTSHARDTGMSWHPLHGVDPE